jgi:hypothetical protein
MNLYDNRPRFGVPEALLSLCPTAKWAVDNNDYNTLRWYDNSIPIPTAEEINLEISRLTTEYSITQYQRDRKSEYPPIEDYLDGVVKGDQQQIAAYIAACKAVKIKYPKPE